MFKNSGSKKGYDIFNRPESFSLESTDDKFEYLKSSKTMQIPGPSVVADKYKHFQPVVEQATLESRVESRCSSRINPVGIATELVPNVLAEDKREFFQFQRAFRNE